MRRHSGFTLIELMITVAIVAILAAIAIPSYTDYVRRSRITDAVAVLSSMRIKMEQYFQDNRDYTNACGNPPSVAPQPLPTAYFNYTCPTHNANAYVVQATGINAMVGFGYTIDQNGGRTTTAVPAGWQTPNPNTCWALKKDGSC